MHQCNWWFVYFCKFELVSWLIDWFLLVYVPFRICSLLWKPNHCWWQGLCSLLRAFEQGEIFIMPHSCHTCWPWFFWSHPKDRPFIPLLQHTRGCGGSILTRIIKGPHSVTSYNTQGDTEDLFLPKSPWVSTSIQIKDNMSHWEW
jgi:hypothetical protein